MMSRTIQLCGILPADNEISRHALQSRPPARLSWEISRAGVGIATFKSFYRSPLVIAMGCIRARQREQCRCHE
jgi:hypothetical protein